MSDDFPKPVLRRDPEGKIALKGTNSTLTCEAASSDLSPLRIEWKKDNVVSAYLSLLAVDVMFGLPAISPC